MEHFHTLKQFVLSLESHFCLSQTDLVLMHVWSPMHAYCSQLAEFIIYIIYAKQIHVLLVQLSFVRVLILVPALWEFKTRMRHKCFVHRNDMEYTQL